jgi:hypothetical protein
MVLPNNYYVGQKFRDITKQAGINTPVIESVLPVFVLNPTDAAAEVQPSFTKPNVRQVLKKAICYQGSSAAAEDTQLATASSTLAVYFVGMIGTKQGASNNLAPVVHDAIAGTKTITTDENPTTVLSYFNCANVGLYQVFPPMPIKVTDGIRVSANATGAGDVHIVEVYWIEETLS